MENLDMKKYTYTQFKQAFLAMEHGEKREFALVKPLTSAEEADWFNFAMEYAMRGPLNYNGSKGTIFAHFKWSAEKGYASISR